jgi:hypothetical protein
VISEVSLKNRDKSAFSMNVPRRPVSVQWEVLSDWAAAEMGARVAVLLAKPPYNVP